MTIRVALNHVTHYRYDRPISVGPQTIRLRPAAHCRTPISAYSLNIAPDDHFLNWLQDPHGNFLARAVFDEPTRELKVAVELIADMTVINPFAFFVEDAYEEFPFRYSAALLEELEPWLQVAEKSDRLLSYLKTIDRAARRTIDFLVDVNRRLCDDIKYTIRMEPGVQTCDQTLEKRSGSCRDSAWLLVQIMRQFGLAARFVSGYLIQLVPDEKSLDGPSGPEQDFTDLHAWAEVFIPGAGWIGLDPTSGLLAGEGHIPLACSPSPTSAAPNTGTLDECDVDFHFEMSVTRVHEDPRVTQPYSDSQWQHILQLGEDVDAALERNDIRLTMGGEPTFVSIDDQDGDEWNGGAVGIGKRQLSSQLVQRLRDRYAPSGLLHFGQGKWYPGESLPRWADSCLWRTDGEPLWSRQDLLAVPHIEQNQTVDTAADFIIRFAESLDVEADHVIAAYEDIVSVIAEEQSVPVDEIPADFDADSSEDRRRLAQTLRRGLSTPTGFVLPLTRAWWQANAKWQSNRWPFRSGRLALIPGDSPLGLRLPFSKLPSAFRDQFLIQRDPTVRSGTLQPYATVRSRALERIAAITATRIEQQRRRLASNEPTADFITPVTESGRIPASTALCVELRNGQICVFLPPVNTLEDYVDLVAHVEATAEALNVPVLLEGYLPPPDPRLKMLKVTPDPGVLEVNVHPVSSWSELVEQTESLYSDARLNRLGTEKFQIDGQHSGTGGGDHIVMGGQSPGDSPFLSRPDLLRSLLGYWNDRPALSYVFSGRFIGPTSQAPRVDEGRRDAIDELELAFRQVPQQTSNAPIWLVDRIFRNLLVDMTGNTHRAEICIDKLYSPDSSTGRLGLVELRAFEMPPHARMSLAQKLLVRGLTAMFWEQPYQTSLVRWGTELHDRFLLPLFLKQDLERITRDLSDFGFAFESDWFAPHLEFRCPKIGELNVDGIELELRQAIEPWYVLGEEPAGGGTTRFVDSSVERLQITVRNFNSVRYAICVNGIEVPLRSTNEAGLFVAGVRYRAWQPPSCLHPNVPIDTPLTVDVYDRHQRRSLGGCRYHVDHPGGINPPFLPVNALEAESRRASRFQPFGHTMGHWDPRQIPANNAIPVTLDLRWGRF